MADNFCKFFNTVVKKNSLEVADGKRHRNKPNSMSDAEIITILIMFHSCGHRCLKHFYKEYICRHCSHLFRKLLSYNRFVELEKEVLFPMTIFVKEWHTARHESKIITLRNQQVILDCDVAELYGVQTKRINEAVNNNPEKFPEGYVIRLNEKEKDELVENFDRFNSQKHSSATLKAFTEKGLYMLATILKSPQAVQTTIAIVEAYAKLRELARVVVEIPQTKEYGAQQKTLLKRSGQLVSELLDSTLPKQSEETSFELNLAMVKFKHSVKREHDDEVAVLKKELEELKKKMEEK